MDISILSTIKTTTTQNVLISFSLIVLSVVYYRWKDSKLRKLANLFGHLRIFIEDLILVAFTATWIAILGPGYGFLLCWRAIIWIYLKLRYGHLGDLVTALDVIGTIDTNESKQIIKSIKILEGKCDLEDLRRCCERTVGRRHANGHLVYPKFFQILNRCGGYFCWRPSQFDINHHLRFAPNLNMNSPSTSESVALDICGKLSNLNFAPNRANWEILVIPKFHYDNEEGVEGVVEKHAIIIRIHHGLGDGYSLMKLIMRDMAGEEVKIPMSKKPRRSLLYGIGVFLYITLKSPRAFYKEMFVRDQNVLHNDKVQASGDKSMIWSDRISLDFLKQTKNKLGSGMSTILLSALAGAIRRYMIEELGVTSPKEINSVMPVPAPNHPDNAMVNKFSIILFPLTTESKDATIRSKEIDRQGRIAAASPDAVMNLFLMNLSGVLPVIFARPFVTNHQATVVVSNIPGPHKSIKLWGRKLCDTMFWLPHLGTSGLSTSFLSYESHLRIGLTVDSGIIPNGLVGAKFLINAMVAELFLMGQSVGVDTTGVLNASFGTCVKSNYNNNSSVDHNNNIHRRNNVSPERNMKGVNYLQTTLLNERKYFRRLTSRE